MRKRDLQKAMNEASDFFKAASLLVEQMDNCGPINLDNRKTVMLKTATLADALNPLKDHPENVHEI